MFFSGQYLCDGCSHCEGSVRLATQTRIAETMPGDFDASKRVTMHFCDACAAEWDALDIDEDSDDDDGFRDPRAKYDDLRSFDAQWTPDDLESCAEVLSG